MLPQGTRGLSKKVLTWWFIKSAGLKRRRGQKAAGLHLKVKGRETAVFQIYNEKEFKETFIFA